MNRDPPLHVYTVPFGYDVREGGRRTRYLHSERAERWEKEGRDKREEGGRRRGEIERRGRRRGEIERGEREGKDRDKGQRGEQVSIWWLSLVLHVVGVELTMKNVVEAIVLQERTADVSLS